MKNILLAGIPLLLAVALTGYAVFHPAAPRRAPTSNPGATTTPRTPEVQWSLRQPPVQTQNGYTFNWPFTYSSETTHTDSGSSETIVLNNAENTMAVTMQCGGFGWIPGPHDAHVITHFERTFAHDGKTYRIVYTVFRTNHQSSDGADITIINVGSRLADTDPLRWDTQSCSLENAAVDDFTSEALREVYESWK